MDEDTVYVITDRGSTGAVRWIVCELRDVEDHSCHGVLIFKQKFYKIWTNTITYRTETSADFPITPKHDREIALVMSHNDDMWREGPGSNIEPKALRYKVES